MPAKIKLQLFQHAYKAHEDNEPDGSVYASEAEADAAAVEAAREALVNWYESDETDEIIDSVVENIGDAEDGWNALREALDGETRDMDSILSAHLNDAQTLDLAKSALRGFESAVYPTWVEFEPAALLGMITGAKGEDGPSVKALLEVGAVLAQQAADRWERGDLASSIQALEEWAGDVREAFPTLDTAPDEEDDGEEEEPREPGEVESALRRQFDPARIPDPVEMTAGTIRPGDRVDAEAFVNLDDYPEAEFELYTVEKVTAAPVVGVTLHLAGGPPLHFEPGDMVPTVRREHFPDGDAWASGEAGE